MKHLSMVLLLGVVPLWPCSTVVLPGSGVVGNGITDDTGAIQSVVNSNAGCSINFSGLHTYQISAFITLPNHTHLQLDSGATITLADHSLLPNMPAMFTNSGWTPGTKDLPFSTANVDITITGSGTLNGNGANQTVSTSTAWAGSVIQLVNVQWVILDGITIQDPPTFSAFCSGCFHGQFTNLKFIQASPGLYMDGMHITGPASDLYIDTLTGTTGDDVVCLCADDGSPTVMPTEGDISTVIVSNLNLNGGKAAVKMLSNTHSVLNVLIQNIAGRYAQSTQGEVIITFTDAIGAGGCNNTGSISGIQIDQITATAQTGWWLNWSTKNNTSLSYSNVSAGSGTIFTYTAGGCAADILTAVGGPTNIPNPIYGLMPSFPSSVLRGQTILRGLGAHR